MKKLISLILLGVIILLVLMHMPSNLTKTNVTLTGDKEFASIPPVPAPKKQPPRE